MVIRIDPSTLNVNTKTLTLLGMFLRKIHHRKGLGMPKNRRTDAGIPHQDDSVRGIQLLHIRGRVGVRQLTC